MPQYDYMCTECDELWIEDLPMKFRGFVTCPICGTGRTKRIILEAPAMTLNWWNARASADTDGITKRFRSKSVNKKARQKAKYRRERRRRKDKEMAHGYN
jgi:putative FmdB family regulatory protein